MRVLMKADQEADRLTRKYRGREKTKRFVYELSNELVGLDRNETWTQSERDYLKSVIKNLLEVK